MLDRQFRLLAWLERREAQGGGGVLVQMAKKNARTHASQNGATAAQCTGLTHPIKLHMRMANKMARTLKYSKKYITFNLLDDDLAVVSFGDAALKNLEEGRTREGTAIVLANRRQLNQGPINCCLIAYTSGRIKRVVLNTYGGELLQQVSCFDHASW